MLGKSFALEAFIDRLSFLTNEVAGHEGIGKNEAVELEFLNDLVRGFHGLILKHLIEKKNQMQKATYWAIEEGITEKGRLQLKILEDILNHFQEELK